jgi:hypothetical protein
MLGLPSRSSLVSSLASSTLASLLAAAGLVATGPAAHAGPYLGLGVGTVPDLGDQMQGFAASSRSGRLMLGQRFSMVAVEGAVGGFQLADARAAEYDAISLSGGGRLSFTLEGPLSLFVRVGLERTWLKADDMPDYRGDGYYGGLGAELRLALPLGETSVWVDYSRHQATLRSGDREIDADSGMWTAGLSVGI